MNAAIKVSAVIMSKVRQWNVPFKPTITYNADFHLNTSLDTYTADLAAFETKVLTYAADEIDRQAEITVQVSIWLDNVTAVPQAKGVVKLPKSNHDFTWSQLDLEQADPGDVSKVLANVIVDMKNRAKY